MPILSFFFSLLYETSIIIAQTRQFRNNFFKNIFARSVVQTSQFFLPHAKELGFNFLQVESHDFVVLAPSSAILQCSCYLNARSTSISKTHFCSVALKPVPEELWLFLSLYLLNFARNCPGTSRMHLKFCYSCLSSSTIHLCWFSVFRLVNLLLLLEKASCTILNVY